MKNKRLAFIVIGALVAALYALLTYVSAALNIAFGAVQFRISEALTVLPFLNPLATFATCLLPRILIGVVAGLLYRLLRNRYFPKNTIVMTTLTEMI